MKSVLTLIAFISGICYVGAQNDPKFGLKAGVNFSNYYIDDVNDQSLKTGFHAGIFTNLPVNDRVSFAPEFLFSQKGAEIRYDYTFARGTADFSFNYFDVPLLFKVTLIPGLNLHAGPYVSFLINSTVQDRDAGGNINFEEELDKEDFNDFDWGFSGGAGFEYSALNLGIRYNYGLVTVGRERTFLGQSYRFPDGKNSVTQLYLGFAF